MKETLGRALLGSFVRKVITFISGFLLTSGWINAELANRLNTEAVAFITTGIITFLLSVWLSYRNIVIEFVKKRIAIALPPSSSLDKAAELATTVPNKVAVAKGEAPVIEPVSGKVSNVR